MDIQPALDTAEWERRLGLEVRDVRTRAGLTQSELATAANVSLSSVKSLEGGRGSTVSTLVRIARALGRSGWLDEFAPPVPPVSPMDMLRREQAANRRPLSRVRHRPHP